MVLVQVHSGSATGTGWTYGPAACAEVVRDQLTPELVGRDPMAVPAAWAAMVRAVRNSTRAGVAGYAVSAVDVALWDLKARLLGLPMVALFGAAHEQVPVYGSGGFTTYDDDRTVEQLTGWVHEQGIPRVKIKVGESDGTCPERDRHRIELARRSIGPAAELFIDANGAWSVKQAVRMLRDVADADVHWLEEPVSSDDLAGLARVRARVDADVTAGEYGTDVQYFTRMCAAGAVDCLQADATRAGGYTAWFRAAAVAAGHGLELSAHCAPNLHAPAAAATPNVRHLEWFHDHVRIESMLFDGALDPAGGTVSPRLDRPGHGLECRPEVVGTYEVAATTSGPATSSPSPPSPPSKDR
ncbi:mandelate racemase [Nocardioides mesophilus]|uniref:Mandelate racemase n=2 Tax=Nocardioides mesophilus TaxID=433659 RepID=A0A7G9RHL0_9ACTN|nr:mandelate racemase [Nocardioides mesophilus]